MQRGWFFRKNRYTSASDLLTELHWLPVEKRIQYKICSIVHKSLYHESPECINELINVYTPTRNLRSADTCVLVKPTMFRKVGEQSFTYSAPLFWNSLPGHVRGTDSKDSFKSCLKTCLFRMWQSFTILYTRCHCLLFIGVILFSVLTWCCNMIWYWILNVCVFIYIISM